MKFIEKVLVILVVVGLAMSAGRIAGGLFISCMAASLLMLVYLFTGFILFNNIRIQEAFTKQAYDGISTFAIIISVVASLALAIMTVGVYLSLTKSKGATMLLGLLLTCFWLLSHILQGEGTVKCFSKIFVSGRLR